jgi:hypothetical protein
VSTEERAHARNTAEVLPGPGQVRFRFDVDDVDGDPCKRFSPGGPVEVWMVASEQPIDAAGGDGYKFVVLPLAFPNYPIAVKHAERLQLLAGAFQAAVAEALEAADTAIPTRDDGHRHVVRFARYSRSIPFVAECEVCMCELVADVRTWARDRGLIDDTFLEERRPDVNTPTIAAAIEQAFNRG